MNFRSFWLMTAALLCGLLGVSVAGTYMMQNRPLVLTVASVRPELVQIQASTPIESAVLDQDNTQIDTYGADIYLQPEAYFTPGQTYSFVFKSIINRFGQETVDVPVVFTVPEVLQYFITSSAQLGVYNLQTNQKTILTPEGFLVNEYVTAGEDVYLLGIPKEQQTADMWDIPRLQSLYIWKSKDQSLTQVLSSKQWDMQGLQASPDGKVLSLYKAQAGGFMVPDLWLYDTTTDTWEQYWNDTFGAGTVIYFSPDNAWLLGIDIATNGYSLSPVRKESDVIPIGNYFENIGISASGRYILFKTYTDEDVLSGNLIFVLFDHNGDSKNILTDPAIIPEIISFDSTTDTLWFTYTDKQEITQIARYDIQTKSTQTITHFIKNQDIISLHTPPYMDVILFGVKEQNLVLEDTESIQGLLDSYFSEENEPIHRVLQYDLMTEETNHLFDGMILKRS